MVKRAQPPARINRQWLQYWLEGEQYDELAQAALEEGIMIGEQIRRCVDFYLEVRKLRRADPF